MTNEMFTANQILELDGQVYRNHPGSSREAIAARREAQAEFIGPALEQGWIRDDLAVLLEVHTNYITLLNYYYQNPVTHDTPDADEIVRLRDEAKVSWGVIAAKMGRCSEALVKKMYTKTTGEIHSNADIAKGGRMFNGVGAKGRRKFADNEVTLDILPAETAQRIKRALDGDIKVQTPAAAKFDVEDLVGQNLQIVGRKNPTATITKVQDAGDGFVLLKTSKWFAEPTPVEDITVL